jgi:hypothetical protein
MDRDPPIHERRSKEFGKLFGVPVPAIRSVMIPSLSVV